VALLPDDPEITQLQAPAVADEHVERRQIAMKRLTAMQLAEHFQNSGDLAPGASFRPTLAAARQVGAEVAVQCVLERQTVQDVAIGANQRKGVVNRKRRGMAVQQLTEVGLAQPTVDARTHFDANDLRNDRRAAEPRGEIDLPESSLA